MVERRFYCANLVSSPVELSAPESHHALSVLRLRVGDAVVLFDGAGREAQAKIAEITRRKVMVDVGEVSRRPFELRVRLTLAVAIIKHHRQNYMIEKCTELGVFAIAPLLADRGVIRTDESEMEKWRRRAVEAAKQARRAWLPAIHSPTALSSWSARIGEFDCAVVADVSVESNRVSLPQLLQDSQPRSMIAFVGPEGGWTEAERALLCAAQVKPISLAPTILRTETAAITACAAAAMHSGNPS